MRYPQPRPRPEPTFIDDEPTVITTFPPGKAHLINPFYDLIEKDGLTHEEAAERLGLAYRIVP